MFKSAARSLLIVALLAALPRASAHVVALADGSRAVVALGQPSMRDGLPNGGALDADGLWRPLKLAADGGGGLYVVDGDNHRVLFYPSGSTRAARVYGQPDFASNTPNNDGNAASAAPSASTLSEPQAVAVDATGVYIADAGNHRVLFFPGASTVAARAYGQPDLVSAVAHNDGAGAPGAPGPATLDYPLGLALDASGLYVADGRAHRVLFFEFDQTRRAASMPAATRVYGQPDFASTTAQRPVSAQTLSRPGGLAVEPAGLYVVDINLARVLFFPAGGPATNPAATRVYGKADFGSAPDLYDPYRLSAPAAVAADASGLYVADTGNSRVLFFLAGGPATNPAATRLYGQPDFEVRNPNGGGGPAAATLGEPQGLALGEGGLFVADTGNHRVVFYAGDSAAFFPAAARVYGQAGFSSGLGNHGEVGPHTLGHPRGVAVAPDGGVYVPDFDSHRVLFYPVDSATPTRVFGQHSFTAGVRNNDGTGRRGRASAHTLATPWAVAADATGLYVADFDNNRVLFFPADGPATYPAATRVYGQPDFFSTADYYAGAGNPGRPSAQNMSHPRGLAIGPDGLYVSGDGSRVLFFPAGGPPVFPTATRVYGQPDFVSTVQRNDGSGAIGPPSARNLHDQMALAADASGLYVADTANHRVLFFPAAGAAAFPAATRVYGQPDFASNVANNNGAGASGPATAQSLLYPNSIAIDAAGVYVADDNQRVLFFPAGGAATFPTATRVYGQPDLVSTVANNDGQGVSRGPSATNLRVPYALALWQGRLHIADMGNNRALAVDDPIADVRIVGATAVQAGEPAGLTASTGAGTAVRYRWDWGDGTTSEGATASHRYGSPGSYGVTVEARNGLGVMRASAQIQVSGPASTRFVTWLPLMQ